MHLHPLLLLHICSAVVALLSGFLAMLLRKGSPLHKLAGDFFMISMMLMTSAGVYLAVFYKPNLGNVMGGTLTFYMTASAWRAGRRLERAVGVLDYAGLFMATAVGVAGLTWGISAKAASNGLLDGYPAGIFFTFASIAGLFALSDLRMILRGGFVGRERVVRHIWRSCLALAMATFSLYPGQAKLFSAFWKHTPLTFVPHIFLLGSMFYWRYRYRARKRAEAAQSPLVPAGAVS